MEGGKENEKHKNIKWKISKNRIRSQGGVSLAL